MRCEVQEAWTIAGTRGTARASFTAPLLTALLTPLLAALLCAACGDGGGDTGAAGAQPLPSVGAPCTNDCVTGFVCERLGAFAGQCTAGCGSGAACQQLAPGTACFGVASKQCGLVCTTDLECPTGTTCQVIDGMLGCRVPATPMP